MSMAKQKKHKIEQVHTGITLHALSNNKGCLSPAPKRKEITTEPYLVYNFSVELLCCRCLTCYRIPP